MADNVPSRQFPRGVTQSVPRQVRYKVISGISYEFPEAGSGKWKNHEPGDVVSEMPPHVAVGDLVNSGHVVPLDKDGEDG